MADDDGGAGNFTKIAGLIPADRLRYTKTLQGTLATCETTCTQLHGCVGFTRGSNEAPSAPAACYIYITVPSLNGADPAASFWLRPGVTRPPTTPTPAPTPGPPKPPTPVLPPAPPPAVMPDCGAFTAHLPSLGCAANGSDCVLSVLVTRASTGIATADADAVVSTNVNLFLPPKSLTSLPPAKISLTIGEPQTDGTVSLTLLSTHTALYLLRGTNMSSESCNLPLILGLFMTLLFLGVGT